MNTLTVAQGLRDLGPAARGALGQARDMGRGMQTLTVMYNE